MTTIERKVLAYLNEHPDAELVALSGYIALTDARNVREHIYSLINKGYIKYSDPAANKLKITVLGIEALELTHRETMRFIISNGIAFIALIISIVSICLQYL